MECEKLIILWTSGDKDTALNMVLMYTLKANSNKWWKECRLITWGPSNKLVAEDSEVRIMLKQIMDTGVKVEACKRCAEGLGVEEKLTDFGIDVKMMGEPFTEYLKDPSYRIITI
ncbi:MAG: DsrE family protein [Anaerovoracaceae bacterium]|nr:DsrE family protein [Clostridiales bacterium]